MTQRRNHVPGTKVYAALLNLPSASLFQRDLSLALISVAHHLLQNGAPINCYARAAFTRSGVNGSSRMRLPVAAANALAMAAAVGPCAASPAPSARSFGRLISTVSTLGTSGMVRIG